MSRGFFIASAMADGVMAWNTTRAMSLSASRPFSFRISSTCQEMASPSRSGSVARMSFSAPLSAFAMASMCFFDPGWICHFMVKSCSGSTDPSFGGRSRTWPKEASTE